MVYKSLKNKNKLLKTTISKKNSSKTTISEKNSKNNKVIVQSLWVGNKLSRMEHYSIKSFLKLGYIYHLYTYENVANVPRGTIIKDGNTIMPMKEVFSLKKITGKIHS